MKEDSENWQGYERTALPVTTIGTLLAAVRGSALLIALPEIMTHLQTDFHDYNVDDPELHAHHHGSCACCWTSG